MAKAINPNWKYPGLIHDYIRKQNIIMLTDVQKAFYFPTGYMNDTAVCTNIRPFTHVSLPPPPSIAQPQYHHEP